MKRHLLVLAVAALTGCSLPGGPPAHELAAEVNETLLADASVIAPGDTLSIRFRLESQYDQEVTVGPDGTADLLAVGPVVASGRTADALRQRLRARYAELEVDDELSVTVLEAAPRTITITGEVEAPGELAIGPDQRLTLAEAIGQAGGFDKRTAWLSNTLLIRWDPEQERQLWWKIDMRPQHWVGDTPIYLQAFDLVYIPNTNIDHVGIFVQNFIARMIPIPVPIGI
jgi:polysaccharide export outer membrane protein